MAFRVDIMKSEVLAKMDWSLVNISNSRCAEREFQVGVLGEDGVVVVFDFRSRGPEVVLPDVGCDPIHAGFGGFQVILGKGAPFDEAHFLFGGTEFDVAGNGNAFGLPAFGEGVERELEVFPEEVADTFSVEGGMNGG